MVYIVHFEEKYYHAQHYVGYTKDIEQRTEQHRQEKRGLFGAINKAGIGWKVVKVLEGDRKVERKIKNRKKTSTVCPICKMHSKFDRAKIGQADLEALVSRYNSELLEGEEPITEAEMLDIIGNPIVVF